MDSASLKWLLVTPDKEWPYLDEQGNPLDRLRGFGKVNIFVGPNNGGKSRLLRSIARQADHSFGVGRAELEALQAWLSIAGTQLQAQWAGQHNLGAVGAIGPNTLQQVALPKSFSATADSLKELRTLVQQLQAAGSGTAPLSIRGGSYGSVPQHLLRLFGQFASDLEQHLQKLDALNVQALAPQKKVYIPVLRGLRHLGGGDIFGSRITTEYFPNPPGGGPEVFTGLSLYESVKSHLLGARERRQRIREYERFLATSIFDVSDVALIPRADSDVLYVKIGQEPERPIHNLGDGIQSIIILTYQLFANERTWFFIEEPELFLHPGLQRKLLNLLLSNEHRTFLTTHSNHFLDMTLDYQDVAVYGISKSHTGGPTEEHDPQFTVELLDSANQNALSLLGVRNSSVFLVNATIWVEGITDRFYIRRLLELYQKTLSAEQWRADEDLHYSFVEYGGGNIVHFSFAEKSDEHRMTVERLCGRALVIADSDNGRKNDRHNEMKAVLGDRLLILPVREIENLLPWSVLGKVIAGYEECDPTSLSAPKASELRTKPLGRVIETTILAGNQHRQGRYAAPSGTIKGKLEFCERALEHMHDPALLIELPSEGRDMLRKIYEFVRARNNDAVESHRVAPKT